MLLTTHSMEEADALCDRLAVFADGEACVQIFPLAVHPNLPQTPARKWRCECSRSCMSKSVVEPACRAPVFTCLPLQLRAIGTSADLKSRFGRGFRITINASPERAGAVEEFILCAGPCCFLILCLFFTFYSVNCPLSCLLWPACPDLWCVQ
jgi:hypothetical protein